jgi:hypothetical protein
MSNFDENRFVSFVQRTRANLDLLDNWRSREEFKPFFETFREVTNLVNSLLGLVVVPEQKILQEILDRVQPVTLKRSGIPEWNVHFRVEGDGEPTDFFDFVYSLRNAISHYDLDFKGDPDIEEVVFEIRPYNKKKLGWDVIFAPSELLVFVKRLADELEKAWAPTRATVSSRKGAGSE